MDLVWIPPWISQVEYLWSEASLAARARAADAVRARDHLRPARLGPVRPAPGRPHARGADGRRAGGAWTPPAPSEAAIAATLEGGPMAALFAATHPDRIEPLIIYATFARAVWAPDYDWAWQRRGARRARWTPCVEHWGEGLVAGSVAEQPHGRPGASWSGPAGSSGWPRARARSARIFDLIGEFDVREVLPVDPRAHARDAPPRRHLHQGRALALHRRAHPGRPLRGARGHRQHVRRRATPRRSSARSRSSSPATRHEREPDRMLATVMFTDIVDSTQRAADLGDRDWRDLLERHDAAVPARARPPPRPRGQAHRATASSPPSTARRARSAAPRRSRRPWRRSGWSSGRASTPASSR